MTTHCHARCVPSEWGGRRRAVNEATDEVTPAGVAAGLNVPAAWGSPPTPLLPRWFCETLSSVPLPDQLRDSDSSVTTVGDLGRFWESRSTPLDKADRSALIGLVRDYWPPPSHVVCPAGFDHAILARYPLRTRTRNSLGRGGLLAGENAITVGQLLSIRNFGITSLLDLMCVVEAGLVPVPSTSPATGPEVFNPQALAWGGVVGLMEPLLAAASEFLGATTLGAALGSDLNDLATTIGLAPAFNAVPIRDLIGGRRITDELLSRIAALQENMSAAERLILEQRVLASSRVTLEELGQQLGVTRERVRQIQHRLTVTIDTTIGSQLRVITALVRQQLGPVIDADHLDDRIAELFADRDDQQAELAGRLLSAQLDYSCKNGICLSAEAIEVVANLREAARSLADEVGLFDETDLRGKLPGEQWNQHWHALFRRCEFHRVGGRPALSDTKKARVKAALVSIGQPATREEIARLCGLDPNRIGSQLSVIPGVIRADKSRWGMAEWIDDEYEGIPTEIIQRINEDGGATLLERLVDELPTLFGVTESSVRAYVGTAQFVLQDGYVSLADESSITLRDLNDVIDGRDASGAPYWAFVVEDRYFDGYSLVGFPPELAHELGCEPNGSLLARIAQPTGCGELSVIWRLSAISGASLGYLSEPLRRLTVSGGERVRLVIKSPGVVELHRENPTEPLTNGPDSSADSLLERMKNRRTVL